MGSKNDGGRGAAIQAAKDMADKARQALEKVNLPDTTKMELALKYPELILSTPEEKLSDTALSMVQEDPELAQAQEIALAEMQQLGQEGFSAEDKAKFEAMRRKVAGDEQARQAAILADMEMRGAGGSGAELAARLSSLQGATQRGAESAEQMAAEAAAARRGALTQAGQMASQMSQQKYGREADAARAKDQIAQFNAGVAARDTAARQAQEAQRVQTSNVEQQYNKELAQRDFENQMAKQGGIAQAYGQAAGINMQAAQLAQPKKGLGGTIGTLAGAGVGGYFGGTQGAGMGAQLGGTVGSQFADGGIKEFDAKNWGGIPEEVALQRYNEMQARKGKELANERRMEQQALEKGVVGSGQVSQEEFDSARGQDKSSLDLSTLKDLSSKISEGLSTGKNESMDLKLSALPQISVSQLKKQQFQSLMNNQQMLGNQLGANYADGGMAYEDGGEGTIIEGDSYSGDELPDRINSGEAVHNLEMQDRLNGLLQELGERRVDEAVDKGKLEVNEPQQEELLAVARGEMEPEEMSDEDIVQETGMKKLLKILGSK